VEAWAVLNATGAQAQKAGLLARDLGSPETVAQLFFAGVHGVATLHIAKANDPWIAWQPVDELAGRMVDVLLRGCGSRAVEASTKVAERPLRSRGRAKRRAKGAAGRSPTRR